MHYVNPEDRTQCSLFTSLDDMISSANPVRVIDLIVNSIVSTNRDKFSEKGQESIGRRAYSPETLLKLYLYGYFNGIRSSRKLEAETHRNIEVMWLLGNLRPDHKTIANFRKDCSDQIKFTTTRFREFLRDEGYIEGKRVGIDGSRMKANAKRSMLSVEKIDKRLSRMEVDMDNYLKQLTMNDLQDDLLEEYGDDDTHSDGIDKHLIEKIASLQEEIEKLYRQKQTLEERGTNRMSTTDPDAGLMKTVDGMVPSYNVQFTVDEKYKLIADSEVKTETNDQELLESMVTSLKEELDIEPEEVIADKGYYNPKLIQSIEQESKTSCYIPVPESSRDRDNVTFTYDSEKDEYRCIEGKRLVLKSRNKIKKKRLADLYKGIECDGCRIRSMCTKSKTGRMYYRYHDEDWCDEFRTRMRGVVAKIAIGIRKSLVEHPFGTIRMLMGKMPLLMRGLGGVQSEINLHTTVYNLKRVLNIEGVAHIRNVIQDYEWKMA
jgi:transposase